MSGVSDIFDGIASGYDDNHSWNVPDPEGLYGAVTEGLPFGRDEELRVLDLGAGTGLLSAVVAERFPKATVTLADFSEEMMKVARQRLDGASGRFEFLVLDYVREPLPGGPESYDLVVSALSFHHLEPADRPRAVAVAHDALVVGGTFVNADRVAGKASEAGAGHRGHQPHHPHHAVGDSTLETQMEWLRDAGFEQVESRYEKNGFAVYGGRKISRER